MSGTPSYSFSSNPACCSRNNPTCESRCTISRLISSRRATYFSRFTRFCSMLFSVFPRTVSPSSFSLFKSATRFISSVKRCILSGVNPSHVKRVRCSRNRSRATSCCRVICSFLSPADRNRSPITVRRDTIRSNTFPSSSKPATRSAFSFNSPSTSVACKGAGCDKAPQRGQGSPSDNSLAKSTNRWRVLKCNHSSRISFTVAASCSCLSRQASCNASRVMACNAPNAGYCSCTIRTSLSSRAISLFTPANSSCQRVNSSRMCCCILYHSRISDNIFISGIDWFNCSNLSFCSRNCSCNTSISRLVTTTISSPLRCRSFNSSRSLLIARKCSNRSNCPARSFNTSRPSYACFN